MRLEVLDLTRRFGRDRGLQPVSFEVTAGERIAIVGHNGAGKSTLLRLLAGWLVPDQGQVLLDGINLHDHRRQLIHRVGFAPEVPNLYDAFSVQYNLNLFARLLRLSRSRVSDIQDQFGLTAYSRTPAGQLSKGLRQRVNLARALLADPPLVLLDEPISGLDPDARLQAWDMLERLGNEGRAIVFSSHNAEDIASRATRLLVLEEGRLVFDGAASTARLNPDRRPLALAC